MYVCVYFFTKKSAAACHNFCPWPWKVIQKWGPINAIWKLSWKPDTWAISIFHMYSHSTNYDFFCLLLLQLYTLLLYTVISSYVCMYLKSGQKKLLYIVSFFQVQKAVISKIISIYWSYCMKINRVHFFSTQTRVTI